MRARALITLSVAAIAVGIAIVLTMHGIGEPGLRAAIRLTARTSALCVILALAGIRAREFQIVLPFSHALHFSAIAVLAFATTPANAGINAISVPFGIAVLALMTFNAVRPGLVSLYILWIIFLVALGTNRGSAPIYVILVVLLVAAFGIRVFRQRAERALESGVS